MVMRSLSPTTTLIGQFLISTGSSGNNKHKISASFRWWWCDPLSPTTILIAQFMIRMGSSGKKQICFLLYVEQQANWKESTSAFLCCCAVIKGAFTSRFMLFRPVGRKVKKTANGYHSVFGDGMFHGSYNNDFNNWTTKRRVMFMTICSIEVH